MIESGMIFQYDRAEQVGMLMLSDGTSKEFSIDNWVDTQNEPFVGQKISYVMNSGSAEVWVEGSQRTESQVESNDEPQESENEIGDMSAHIEYFSSMGFNLVKDRVQAGVRTVNMRYYRNGEFGEATIKEIGGKISFTQSQNGQTII